VIKKACRSYHYDRLYLLSTTSIALSLNLTDIKETILDFPFVLSCIDSGSIEKTPTSAKVRVYSLTKGSLCLLEFCSCNHKSST